MAIFAKGLSLLDDYDHEQLDAKGLTEKEAAYPSLDDYQKLINQMLTEFDSDVFGKSKYTYCFFNKANSVRSQAGGFIYESSRPLP